MRVEHVVIFKIGELPEGAQHEAHGHYLSEDHGEPAWADENRKSMEAFCETFPVQAADWQYGSGGSYVRAEMETGRYDEAVWELTGLRLRTWLVNNFEHVLYAGRHISIQYLVTDTTPYRYKSRRSKALVEESCCPFTGYCMDEDLLDPIRKFIRKPDRHGTLADLLSEALESWVRSCQDECEAEEEFDYFFETAQANEWEFTADGRRV